MNKPAPRDILFPVGILGALAVPFLPFSDCHAPVEALAHADASNWLGLLMLTVTYLAIPVLMTASTVGQALFGPLTRPEAWAAYGVSFLSLAALLASFVSPHALPAFAAPGWTAAAGAIVVLALTMRGPVPRSVHAHVAMVSAWVLDCAVYVLGTAIWGRPGPGFWCAVVAIPCLAADAAIRTRDALRGAGGPAQERAPAPAPAGAGRPGLREIAFAAAAVPGVGVVFLPFALKVIPGLVLFEPDLFLWQAWAPVVAASLAVPILASTVRQALFGPLTKWEVRAAYALALAVLAAAASLMLMLTGEDAMMDLPSSMKAVVCPSVLLLAAGAAVALVATRRGSVPPATHAHVAMLVAWVPNAAFWIAVFAFAPARERGPGYYLALAAFAAYAVEAALRVRDARRAASGSPSGVRAKESPRRG